MRPATVVELARRNDVPLPVAEPSELYRYDSLDGFLRVFWLVQSTLVRPEDWSRLAYESVVDGARHGVVYREAFFTPARHLADGQDLASIVAGLDEGLSAAEAETGARCFLIADMDRAFGPAAGLELVERLAALRRSGARGIERVLGIGMDSTELGIDQIRWEGLAHTWNHTHVRIGGTRSGERCQLDLPERSATPVTPLPPHRGARSSALGAARQVGKSSVYRPFTPAVETLRDLPLSTEIGKNGRLAVAWLALFREPVLVNRATWSIALAAPGQAETAGRTPPSLRFGPGPRTRSRTERQARRCRPSRPGTLRCCSTSAGYA